MEIREIGRGGGWWKMTRIYLVGLSQDMRNTDMRKFYSQKALVEIFQGFLNS